LSFPGYGATRAAETLTIPTAGVVSATEGTIECFVYIDSKIRESSFNRYIWGVSDGGSSSSPNTLCLRHSIAGYWTLQAVSAGGSANAVNILDNLSIGWHRFAARWSAQEMALLIDGGSKQYINNPLLPSTFNSTLRIGDFPLSGGTYCCDTLIDDLRISNIARDGAEILDSYNTGAALPIDAHTTAKMAFDGTLEIFARPIIFAGTIDAPEAIESDPGYLYYPITAVDYNQIADKRLYAASHENTLAGNIVSAIISARRSYNIKSELQLQKMFGSSRLLEGRLGHELEHRFRQEAELFQQLDQPCTMDPERYCPAYEFQDKKK
jgi:hypothetical protein